MAHRKLDSVQQIATGTGTGALTLGAATAANYRTMQAAGMTNADTGTFRIQHETIPAEWEEVLVTYSAGAITRTFDTNARSATGSLISFSAGNKIVSCIARAGDSVVMDNNGDVAVTRDAAIGRNATVAGTLGVTGAAAVGGSLTAGTATPVSQSKFTVAGSVSINGADGNFSLGGIRLVQDLATADGRIGTTDGGVASGTTLGFWTSSGAGGFAQRVWITAAGNFGVGVSPTCKLQALGADGSPVFFGYGATKGARIIPSSSGVTVEGISSDQATYQPIKVNGSIVDIATAGTTRWEFSAGGDFLCFADNTNSLGGPSNRASVVYSATAAINTSGRDAKLFVSGATAAERRAAITIKAKPRRYKLKDSVDEKGEERARWHFGYVAEDVRDALEAEGLDPWAYAFLCSDPLIKRETYFEAAMRPKMRTVRITDATVEIIDGKPVMVRKEIERDEPVGELVAVVNEVGQPVMQQIGADEETGEPILAPMLHFVPEMEDYEVERTREVDTGEVRLGLRYSELEAFLRSAD